MKKLLVKRSDGGVSIILPTSEATPETLERDAKAVDGYLAHEEIDDSNIPDNRLLRNAWIHNDSGLKICPNRSRTIIREKRNNSLDKLDNLAIKEARKPKGNIASLDAEAQRLRNIPQHTDFNSDDISKLEALVNEANLQI